MKRIAFYWGSKGSMDTPLSQKIDETKSQSPKALDLIKPHKATNPKPQTLNPKL